jgi:endonuclease IV
MENYKSAAQQKLRYQTTKGLLNTEQLWDLSLNELDSLAVALETEHQQSGKKSFLAKTSAKDKTAKLKFDIVLDVLNTKSEEAQALKDAAEIKAHNSKIINLISEKQDESLRGKSVKQLEAMLK